MALLLLLLLVGLLSPARALRLKHSQTVLPTFYSAGAPVTGTVNSSLRPTPRVMPYFFTENGALNSSEPQPRGPFAGGRQPNATGNWSQNGNLTSWKGNGIARNSTWAPRRSNRSREENNSWGVEPRGTGRELGGKEPRELSLVVEALELDSGSSQRNGIGILARPQWGDTSMSPMWSQNPQEQQSQFTSTVPWAPLPQPLPPATSSN
jgi:hypothetical protein